MQQLSNHSSTPPFSFENELASRFSLAYQFSEPFTVQIFIAKDDDFNNVMPLCYRSAVSWGVLREALLDLFFSKFLYLSKEQEENTISFYDHCKKKYDRIRKKQLKKEKRREKKVLLKNKKIGERLASQKKNTNQKRKG